MKHILTQIFVTLGAIFLVLIVIGIYFFVTDPYNLRPLLFGESLTASQFNDASSQRLSESEATTKTESSAKTETNGFQLSEAQKQALIGLGIDPAAVPASISAEQEACFVSALGEARVSEIKAGAVPSTLELLKAKSCI